MPRKHGRPNIASIMMILKTTLVCLMAFGISACTAESGAKVDSSVKAADSAKTPAATKVAMTTTALELAKIP